MKGIVYTKTNRISSIRYSRFLEDGDSMGAGQLRSQIAKWTLIGAGTPILLIGFVVIVGWFFGRPNVFFADNPHSTSMQFNAALSLTCIGGAFLYLAFEKERYCRWLSLFVCLFCIAVIWEYLLEINLRIDEIFFKYTLLKSMKYPGRMAMNTAVVLSLGGLGIFFLTYPQKRGAIFFAALFSSLIASISMVSFIGYLTGLEGAIGWSDFSKMAFSTSVPCVVMGLSLLTYIGILFWDSKEGTLALPIAGMAGIIAGTFTTWQVFRTQNFLGIEELARQNAKYLVEAVEEKIVEEILAINRFVQRWDALGGYTNKLWQVDAGNYLTDFMGLQAMQAYDEHFQLLFEIAKGGGPPSFSEPLDQGAIEKLKNGNLVFTTSENKESIIVYDPLFIDYSFKGVVVGKLNIISVVRQNIIALGLIDHRISLFFQNTLLYSGGNNKALAIESPIILEFNKSYIPWKLHFYINRQSISQDSKDLHLIILTTGFTIAILVAILIYFGQGLATKKAVLQNLNDDLIRATERADAANAAKGIFLATMSHEIRTPLNAIVGTAQMLEETEATEIQKKYIERISVASNALLTLISDILDFSKIESGSVSLHLIPAEIGPMIKGIGNTLVLRGREKQIEIYIDGPIESLPPLLLDPIRLQQILNNLGNNALKFTEKGSITIKTALKARSETQVLMRFEVIDTGIGISDEDKTKLFQRFSQLESTRHIRQYGGVGLGLSICKKLVDLMGGTIGVTSQIGKGSIFWFELTLKTAGANPPPRNLREKKIALELSKPKEKEIVEKTVRSWEATIVSEGAHIVICDAAEEAKKIKNRNMRFLLIVDKEIADLPDGAIGVLSRPFGPAELYEQLAKGL